MRIALSTGGGDAPGLNAVIRAAVLSACNRGWEVLGIKKGYAGLLGEEEVEVMGRNAGFIALHAGLAGTADVILIPEIPYDIEKVCEKIAAPAGRGGTSLLW
jgi:6-phosphofructokinase